MNDTTFALHVLPHDLQCLHRISKDSDAILALAKNELLQMASKDGDEFLAHVPKALMLLALLDHLNDRRACGMIGDYLDF